MEDKKIISIISGKGGVGKTTVTTNLVLALAIKEKKKILVIDMDIGNLLISMGIEKNHFQNDLLDVIYNDVPLSNALYKYHQNLYFTKINRTNLEDLDTNVFKNYINEMKSLFDLIILDVGAGINENFKKSVISSEAIIFVIEPTILSYKISERTYEKIKNNLKIDVPTFLVINKYDPKLSKKKIILTKEKILEIFKIKLIGILPYEIKNIKYLNKKTPYYLSKEENVFFVLYNNIAKRLMENLNN